jgi:DNA-directed RNA polymerase subunit H (RpoH/RPB5)
MELTETERLWKSYQTMTKMCLYRRYSPVSATKDDAGDEPDGILTTYEQFVERVGEEEPNRRAMMTTFTTATHKVVELHYIADFNHAESQNLYSHLLGNTDGGACYHAIVVTKNITSNTAMTIRALKNQRPSISIETFMESETMYTVIDHVLVPKHIICSTEKKLAVMEAYSVKGEQIPQIKATEPISKYIGAVKGNLVKIVRPSDSIKKVGDQILYDISYRIVV